MLLRNLNPDQDMCNGTNAIVRRISQRCVWASFLRVGGSGSREFTPTIPLQSPDTDPPFTLARFQFPRPAVFCDLYE